MNLKNLEDLTEAATREPGERSRSRRTQWGNPRQGDEASDEALYDG